MKGKVCIYLLLISLIITACSNQNVSKKVIRVNDNIVKTDIVNEAIITGGDYRVKGLTNIYDSPQIYNSSKVLLRCNNNDRITVLEVKDDFARISLNHKEGWILNWYLTRGEREIIETLGEPFEKVIRDTCSFYACPDETSIRGYEIRPGTVVHIMSEYKDWLSSL